MRAILSRGAGVNARGKRGTTALHIDAESNQAGAVDALIEAGAGFELKTTGGLTPLLAATARSTACTAVLNLLRHGAAVTAGDHAGRTPLHWVCRTGGAVQRRL